MSESTATTRGVQVDVRSHYVPERSSPDHHSWFFVYHVQISNVGEKTVQLETRHWIITDADGHIEEVEGPGVVGETPVLEPGEMFEYTSGCQLATESGFMHGTYQMVTDDGQRFDAEIAPFQLGELPTVH